MRTLHSISAIRHLIPLFIVSAALLSTSSMCESSLFSEPDTPVTPTPTPTPGVVEKPSIGRNVLNIVSYPSEAAADIKFTVMSESGATSVVSADGCSFTEQRNVTYEQASELYIEEIVLSLTPQLDTFSVTVSATNEAGTETLTVPGWKAMLTYPPKHMTIGLDSQIIDFSAKGNFGVTETLVDTIGTYIWRNLVTGYKETFIKLKGNAADVAYNRGIHWRTTETRNMVFVVTAKATETKYVRDTIFVEQPGDDLSWAWDEIDAYCEIVGMEPGRDERFRFSNYQELLDNEIFSFENCVHLQDQWGEERYGESYAHYGRRLFWTPSDAHDGHVHGISLIQPTDEYFELSPKVGKLKYAEFLWIENKTGGIKWPLPDEVKELENMTDLSVRNCGVTARLESQELLKYLVTREKNPVEISILENNFYGPVPSWLNGRKCGSIGSNKLEGVVPQAYDKEFDGDNDYYIRVGFLQQDGYEIWKSTDSKPEGYEYHESYYWE